MDVSLPGAKVTAESMEVATTVKNSPNSRRESSVMATLKERELLGPLPEGKVSNRPERGE